MSTMQRKQTVYLVRHAQAEHNILEKKAVEDAIANGIHEKEEQEKARRSVLNDVALKDACLSPEGTQQARSEAFELKMLNQVGGANYAQPTLILVSPLRRSLMTATELFSQQDPKPRFVALEALREKRTGFFADERSHVDDLEKQFPHVDFSDLRVERPEVPKGEDNPAVRARGKAFLEGTLSKIVEESVALVTHKGWLRELRHTLRSYIECGELEVNFDIEKWDQTLYKNAEVRVNEFGWEDEKLKTVVSKSVQNAMSSVIQESVRHLISKHNDLFNSVAAYDVKNDQRDYNSRLADALKEPNVFYFDFDLSLRWREAICSDLDDPIRREEEELPTGFGYRANELFQ